MGKRAKMLGRVFTPGKILGVLFAFSLFQYTETGQVSWVTDSFRWTEQVVAGFVRDPQGTLQKAVTAVSGQAERAVQAVSTATLPTEITGADSGIYRIEPADGLSGRVVKVTDGDTITILDSSNSQLKVRLTGIDAPEKGQPFGAASKTHLASLVAGRQVRVESDKKDRYGRVLGKVWVQPADCPSCGKTLDVNHAQLLAGMAWWYRYYAREQSPEDRGRYESAEDEAKARKWGLWSDPDPINPYDWRKERG